MDPHTDLWSECLNLDYGQLIPSVVLDDSGTDHQLHFPDQCLLCISNRPLFTNDNSDYGLHILDNLCLPTIGKKEKAKQIDTHTDKERKILKRLTSSERSENTFAEQIRQDELWGLNRCTSCFKTASKAIIPCCHITFCNTCVKDKYRCGVCRTLIREIWSL